MRLTRLLLVAFLILVAGRTAASQEAKTSDIRPAVASFTDASSHVWTSRPADRRRNAADTRAEDGDDICLTMHTMQVARDEKGSDATHLVAERTCTPASQFQTKSAVVTLPTQK